MAEQEQAAIQCLGERTARFFQLYTAANCLAGMSAHTGVPDAPASTLNFHKRMLEVFHSPSLPGGAFQGSA